MLNFKFHILFDDSKVCVMYKPHVEQFTVNLSHDVTSSFPQREMRVILLVSAWNKSKLLYGNTLVHKAFQ